MSRKENSTTETPVAVLTETDGSRWVREKDHLAALANARKANGLHDLTEKDLQSASIDWGIAEVDLGLGDTDWGCMEHVLKMFIRHRRAKGRGVGS